MIRPLIVVATLLCASIAWGQDRPASQRSETPAGKRFVYKQSAGEPQALEVYFPPGHDPRTAKVPGVILFHGGGWSSGDLRQFRTACSYLASRGLVAATANYRMHSRRDASSLPEGESRKRVCITDAKSAIRWFKQQSAQLGVDPERIITGGGSAGGHIAVLATTNPGLNDPSDPSDIDTSVVAYLLFNPAFSSEDSADSEVDALRHVSADFAPAVVFFGTEDKWKTGWDVVHAKLSELGNTTVDLQLAKGANHSFFNRDPWQTVTLVAADRFLAELGLITGEPTLDLPSSGERLMRAKAHEKTLEHPPTPPG